MRRTLWMAAILLAVLTLVPVVAGRTPSDDDSDRDRGGVSLGVARVSVAGGDVYVQRGSSGDRMKAMSGVPLLARDLIGTGRASRAEVQLGPANFVRLGPESELRFKDLGNRYYRVEVVSGSVTYSELRGGESEMEIQAPRITVRPLKRGVYRIFVRESGQTDITVRNGEAEVASGSEVRKVKKGRRMTVRGEGEKEVYRTVKADGDDAFDKWNDRRNRHLAMEPAYRGWGYYGDPWYPYYFGFGYGFYGWPGGFYGPRSVVMVRAPVARHPGGHGGRR